MDISVKTEVRNLKQSFLLDERMDDATQVNSATFCLDFNATTSIYTFFLYKILYYSVFVQILS